MMVAITLLMLVFANYANAETIVEYEQKACDLDIGGGCFNLGLMYDKGKGIRQSNQKALKYYGKACDLKEELGCKNYARLKNQGL